MERQMFISELYHMKLIAHRLGYQMTQYPENSLEVLKSIFESKELLNACDGFEFDICFTKDHIPVVIHDKYIDDISDNYGLIEDYTLEELRKLMHLSQNWKFGIFLVCINIVKVVRTTQMYVYIYAKYNILTKITFIPPLKNAAFRSK